MNDKVAFVSITLTTTIVKTKIVTMTTIIKNGNNNQCPVNCDHNNVTTVILHFCDSSKKHRFIDLINSIWRSTMIQQEVDHLSIFGSNGNVQWSLAILKGKETGRRHSQSVAFLIMGRGGDVCFPTLPSLVCGNQQKCGFGTLDLEQGICI